ncbi:hypothetical protein BSK54_22025 [Paenibacillus odorifer]|jgi:glycosyltransferase involved in cell wall biosynthesis|uniref:glycosyltransferase family 4 protein n=1 Tax=Paenibacillus odorifer TaxID=189426 RepID=UPI00096BFC1A|nr:glycosyltransferase family 4 protein [Paenibacillus odorifer]OMD98682.1 hypothetical protein BSK54_22025 [Paenibacillus odorifer]
MRISFVLPPPSLKIAGGYKVVYQYANYCANNGMEVKIIYDCGKGRNSYKMPKVLFYQLKKFIARIEPRWFILNDNIEKLAVYEINNQSVPNADFIVATACGTSMKISQLDETKGKKNYLIQGFENWNRTDQEVIQTYKYDMKKIVISKWLKEVVDKYSSKSSIYIPNGIDKNKFYITKKIEDRYQYSVAMLYHNDKRKRSDEGLKILLKMKEKYPQLRVELFGSPKKPSDLPKFVNYTRNANEKQLHDIYNNSSIFLVTSSVEGYGLTGIESMCCGSALVSTDCQGVKEYAENGNNALLSPVDRFDLLEKNLDLLLENNNLRINYARVGSDVINDFNIEASEEKFLSNLIN